MSEIDVELAGGLLRAGGDMLGSVGQAPEVDVASAATCDIGAVNSDRIRITGVVAITSLGTMANRRKRVRFAGALTLTHNGASLILPGATNIQTAAGDTAEFESDAAGNWRLLRYVRAASRYEGGFGPATLIGAAATTDIGLYPSHLITLGGSQVTISSFGASASLDQPIYVVRFNTPHTLVHNAVSMILPAAANIVFTTDDVGIFQYLGGGNWRMIGFMRANGWLSAAGPVGQIAFPAAQAASTDPNTLDDYEEGTFTLTLTTDGSQPSGVTFNAGSDVCRYIKVGRAVFIYGRPSLSSKGTGGTGNINFTGGPFVCPDLTAIAVSRSSNHSLTSGNQLTASFGTTTMLMEQCGATTFAGVPWSAISDNFSFAFHGFYMAAA